MKKAVNLFAVIAILSITSCTSFNQTINKTITYSDYYISSEDIILRYKKLSLVQRQKLMPTLISGKWLKGERQLFAKKYLPKLIEYLETELDYRCLYHLVMFTGSLREYARDSLPSLVSLLRFECSTPQNDMNFSFCTSISIAKILNKEMMVKNQPVK